MGKKKSGKGKDKRMQRKEEAKKFAQASERVKDANKGKDAMDKLIPQFRKYDRNGVSLEIQSGMASDFSTDIQDWALSLTRTNMAEVYGREWSDSDKAAELTEETARYLVAVEGDKPVGFVHYRFDIDYEWDVLYCYELQVDKEYQRKGLGKFLMKICEMLAFQHKITKVVLTVFKENKAAQAFYRNVLRYDEDDSNPDLLEEARYDILSKTIMANRITEEPQTPAVAPLSVRNTSS